MSGCAVHPFAGHWRGGGASFSSPDGAPLSAHFEMISSSFDLSEGSLEKWPTPGSADQGGIFRLRTAAFIAFAQGRVLGYVRKDIGAMLPGRWQVWQCCWRIGRTSLWNVTEESAAAA